jgi:SulP family sulfate permease
MISPPADSVQPFPFLSWPRLQLAALRGDLQAGVTVATFAVPQAMAYATLAGVPPVHGLYAAAAMAFVGALWGSSPFVNTGPTNTAALLTASALAPFALQAGSDEFWRILWLFTVLVGILRLGLGLLRAAPLVRLVPEHALIGFVTAADLLIAIGQLHEFLGIKTPQGSTAQKIFFILQNLSAFQWRTLAIGLLTLAVLIAFDKFSKRVPVALGAIVVASVVAYFMNSAALDDASIALVKSIASVPYGLPTPRLYAPDLALWSQMLPAALAVASIGLLEAVSISSTLALKKKQRVNFNQEFFGQGVAQIAGAFASGFPGSASYSRSALIEANGAKTAWANIFFAVATVSALVFAPKLLEMIPLPALAALLLFTGVKLVDFKAIKRVFATSKADFAVVALTFFVTFFGKLEWGFFVGIVAALCIFVSRAKALQIFELTPRPDGRFNETPYNVGSNHGVCDVVAIGLHGDLFFGHAHELREQMGEILRLQDPKFIVIRLRRAHSIDAACWNVIFDFADAFSKRGGKLYLSGLTPKIEAMIKSTGLDAVLPSDQLIARKEGSFDAFEIAISRIAEQIEPDARLCPAWESLMEKQKLKQSVSFWRDPAMDTKTMGFTD